MRAASSFLKASALTALLFALSWIRLPVSTTLIGSTFGLFIVTGLVLLLMSLLIGIPIVAIAEKLWMGRCLLYSLLAAAVGALFAAFWGHPPPGLSNAHGGMVFSPFTRSSPGIDVFPASKLEYASSIAYCAALGGILGATFSHFYRQKARPDNSLERDREQ